MISYCVLQIQEKQINEYEQKIQKLISNKLQIQKTYINKDKPNSIPAQTEETIVDDEEFLLEEAANCSDNDSEDEADPDTIYQPTQVFIFIFFFIIKAKGECFR